MELQLIDGVFERNEIMDLIAKMVDVKIKYHEGKIEKSANEDDVKMRERKIRHLQDMMYNCRYSLKDQDDLAVSARVEFNS